MKGELNQLQPSIVLFHSVLGIRQGEINMANLMRSLGFEVTVPDLYNGKVFDNYEEALVLFEEMGVSGLIELAQKSLLETEGPIIFAGFSNGGALAEVMALQYPHVVGCILFHAALPITEIGATVWPKNLPVQIHYADKDPWRDESYVEKFLKQVNASGSPAHFFEYSSNGHLFTDSTLPDEYNEEETKKVYHHVTQFLKEFN